ncbi:MAG: DUF1295 domain-containing protein [Sporichthyaceae bacterium]
MDSFDGGAFAAGLTACAGALAVLFAATFLVARRLGKHSVVDIAWGMGFVLVIAVTAYMAVDHGDPSRQSLVTIMVLAWGSRLAWHIGRRNAGHGEDPRYEALLAKVEPAKRTGYALRMIYGVQAALVLFISLPVQVAQYSDDPVGVLGVIGALIWAVGLFFESVGDAQLAKFKADPANKGKIMDRGLWRYTRHPNYFGDACVWTGLYLVAAETGVGALTILSPLVMIAFLTKGSGAALTERRMAGRPGMDDYIARTSGFLPRPPRKAGGS